MNDTRRTANAGSAKKPAVERLPRFWPALAGEFTGTFLLVFFGVGAVNASVITGAQVGLWQVAAVWAIGVALGIYASASLSGGHINPAITAVAALYDRFPLGRVVPYWVAQVAGAAVASLVLYALFAEAIIEFERQKGLLRVGAEVLAFFPKAVVGGIVAFLGFDLLLGSFYREWNKLPLVDFMIILLIFVVATTVGFLEGVAIGIVAGAIMFIITYSKINVVRQEYLGSEFRSNVDRIQAEEEILKTHGSRTVLMVLQGFIFFGTANQIYDLVREKIAHTKRKKLRHVVIDFSRVTGLDSSAVHSFTKLVQLMQEKNIVLVFTGLSERLAIRFSDSEMNFESIPSFKDLDGGIEWCEERILEALSGGTRVSRTSLQKYLAEDIFTKAQAKAFLEYLEDHTYEPGDHLLTQGSDSDDILFIEKGRVTVQLEFAKGKSVRLRSIGPGTVVGEIGNYLGLPRTASVVADEPCSARRLTHKTLKKIEQEQPALIATFHKFMARRLSQKLADSNRMLEAALR